MAEEKNKMETEKEGTQKDGVSDRNHSKHRSLKVRGRIFRGVVIKKFPKRIVIEFDRMIYVTKYERYQKKKTKIHARLPDSMEKNVEVGDYVEVGECRPLSKLVHFVFIKNIGGKK